MADEKDDIIIEDDPDSTSQAAATKKLREKLKAAEDKAREYLDGWQRAQADFANLRKRDEEAKQEFVRFASAGLMGDLIPVLDSFNIAISSGHSDLEPIRNQLFSVLKSHSLEEIEPLGETFDPAVCEAIAVVPTERKEEDNTVVEVAQKGYKLAGKVIRPAKIKVGEYRESQ